MFVEYPGTELRAAPGPARLDDSGGPPVETPGWRTRDVGYGLALAAVAFFGILGAAFFVIAFWNLDDQSVGFDVTLAMATVLLELSLAVIVLLLARSRGLSLADIGFRRPQRWGPLVVAWFGAYFILTLYTVTLALLRQLGIDTSAVEGGNALPIESNETTAVLVLLGISVVVLAPFCEEMFFRSLVYRGIRRGRSVALALAVSGLMFGAFHFSWAVLLPFTGIGVLFAWANDRTGSLWTSIVAHACFNGLAFTIAILVARGDL